MSSFEAPSDRYVTVSRVRLERDDSALADEFKVLAIETGEKRNWCRRFRAGLDASAARPDVAGVAYDRSVLYLLVPKDASTAAYIIPAGADAAGAGFPPRVIPLPDVPDFILMRLMISSCAREFGVSGKFNDTSRYLRILKREKNSIRTIEVSIAEDMGLKVGVVTFTKRAYLLSRRDLGEKKTRELRQETGYSADGPGVLVNSHGADGDYIQKSLSKFDAAFYVFGRGEEAKKVMGTRLYALNELLVRLRRRFPAAGLGLVQVPETAFHELKTPEELKSDVLAAFADEEIFVSAAKRRYAGLARELATRSADAGFNAVYSPRVRDGLMNIVVVPDEVSGKDGYELAAGTPIQHLAAGTAALIVGDGGKKPRLSLIPCLLKELVVKGELERGVAPSLRGIADGYDRVELTKASLQRGRGVEKGVADSFTEVPSRATLTPGGQVEFRILSLNDMSDEEVAALLDPSDPSRCDTDAILLRLEKDGEQRVLTIRDTGLFTVPNNMDRMIERQIVDGELKRSKASGGFDNELAPLYGVGLFELDGDVCYFVGHSKKMKRSIARACKVRRIAGDLRPGDVELLFSMLDVGLARLGQPTVRPILSKYIDEYVRSKTYDRGEQMILDL